MTRKFTIIYKKKIRGTDYIMFRGEIYSIKEASTIWDSKKWKKWTVILGSPIGGPSEIKYQFDIPGKLLELVGYGKFKIIPFKTHGLIKGQKLQLIFNNEILYENRLIKQANMDDNITHPDYYLKYQKRIFKVSSNLIKKENELIIRVGELQAVIIDEIRLKFWGLK